MMPQMKKAETTKDALMAELGAADVTNMKSANIAPTDLTASVNQTRSVPQNYTPAPAEEKAALSGSQNKLKVEPAKDPVQAYMDDLNGIPPPPKPRETDFGPRFPVVPGMIGTEVFPGILFSAKYIKDYESTYEGVTSKYDAIELIFAFTAEANGAMKTFFAKTYPMRYSVTPKSKLGGYLKAMYGEIPATGFTLRSAVGHPVGVGVKQSNEVSKAGRPYVKSRFEGLSKLPSMMTSMCPSLDDAKAELTRIFAEAATASAKATHAEENPFD